MYTIVTSRSASWRNSPHWVYQRDICWKQGNSNTSWIFIRDPWYQRGILQGRSTHCGSQTGCVAPQWLGEHDLSGDWDPVQLLGVWGHWLYYMPCTTSPQADRGEWTSEAVVWQQSLQLRNVEIPQANINLSRAHALLVAKQRTPPFSSKINPLRITKICT